MRTDVFYYTMGTNCSLHNINSVIPQEIQSDSLIQNSEYCLSKI